MNEEQKNNWAMNAMLTEYYLNVKPQYKLVVVETKTSDGLTQT